jgi:spermidine/putrescine transport system permease protein
MSSTIVTARPLPENRVSPVFRLAMLLPGGLVTFFLILFALGLVVFLAFRSNDGSLLGAGLTAQNFLTVVTDPLYWTVTLRSLIIAGLVTLATVVTAYPVAYYLAFHAGRRRNLLLFLVTLPFWTSYLLRVYAWIAILGQGGAVNRALAATGVVHHPVGFLLYDRPAVLLVLVYLYFPFAALSLYAVLERFDWDQLRAAMDLGAPPLVAIRRILLPQVRSGISTAFIFVFVPILGEYLTPQLVGGTRGVMIGNLIVNFFNGAEYARGAAAALLVAAVIVVLLVVFRRSLNVQSSYGS